MSVTTKNWGLKTVEKLSASEMEELKRYLEYLVLYIGACSLDMMMRRLDCCFEGIVSVHSGKMTVNKTSHTRN